MKVMHFVSGIKSGGVEQFLFNYTKRMNKEFDMEEYIIYQHDPNPQSLAKLEEAGNECIQISSKTKRPLKNLIETYKLIRRIKPDIVHAHMNLLNFFPLFMAFIQRTPVRISHSHIASDNISMGFLIPLFKKFNKLFSNTLFSCGEMAGKYMYAQSDFYIIENAIDTEKYVYSSSSRKKLREKFGIDSETVVFGNIGRMTKQKNQLQLIDFFLNFQKEKKNAQLFILGDGELKKMLQIKIDNYGMSEKIHILSTVEDTAPFYSMIDSFILPSLYEGFPVVAVEAQSVGVPALLSNTIDPGAIINENSELIDLKNDRAWINAMLEVNINANKPQVDSYKLANFNIDKTYKKLYLMYEELVSERKKA